MHLYCKRHDETQGLNSSILSEDCFDHYCYDVYDDYKKDGWIDQLRLYVSGFSEYLIRHKDCLLVVNNFRGEQVWPENIAEKEMSDAEKGICKTSAEEPKIDFSNTKNERVEKENAIADSLVGIPKWMNPYLL